MRLLTDFIRLSCARVRACIGRNTPPIVVPELPPTEAQNTDQEQFAQAQAFHQRGQLNEAESIFWKLLQKYPQDFDLLHQLGMVHGQRNNFSAAAEFINRAIEFAPNNSAAHCSLGNCLKGLSRYEEALASYDRALALRPNDADVLSNRGATLRDLKRPEEALESYERALAIDPNHVLALDNRGTTLRELKRPEEALASYDRALAANPDYASAHYNRGVALTDLNRYEDALPNFERTIALDPDHCEAHCSLGIILHGLKRHEDALSSYDKALLLQPNHTEALLNRGATLRELNRHEDALECFDRLLNLKPDHVVAHFSRGISLGDLRRYEDALASYDRALTLQPDYVEAHNNRGTMLRELRQDKEALSSYERALAISPDHLSALLNRGNLLVDFKRTEDAIRDFTRMLALDPDCAEAHSNLSSVYREQNRFVEAEHHLRQALRIKPSFANFYYNLATLLMTQGRSNDAIENFSNALKCNPDHHAARAILLHLLQKACRWEALDSNIETLRRNVYTAAESAENASAPFAFIALPGTTPEEQKLCTEKWVRFEYQHLAALCKTLAFDHRRPLNKKSHIGYLSGDFRDHPVASLMAQVFELHNRDQFHITAYSYGPDDGSEMRKRLINAFSQFIDIRGYADADSARRIYADHIDILVDLSGFTEHSRSGILALRPAPLQVNFQGYPGTMGAAFVDYLIADSFIIPPEFRKHYTEKIVYLPNCYQPNDRTRPRLPAPTRKDCGLPETGCVFCCFNQTYKIAPAVFDIWCRLLIAVRGSVLWLRSSTPYAEENLRREAENRGVNPARLVMAPSLKKAEDHLARLQCADMFLDTLPYNAHTTCSDALWMGLPVVTCAGETFPSRVAGSLLSAMGVPELITYNLEDYYHLALDLASDRKKLDAIRSRIIANRDTAPLFDSTRFTRDLESAYITMSSIR